MKKIRNYYSEIDNAIKSYEEYKSWHDRKIEWISDRICWCWKFKHITKEQMESLCDRVCNILENK